MWVLIFMLFIFFFTFIFIQKHQWTTLCLPMFHLKWRLLQFTLPAYFYKDSNYYNYPENKVAGHRIVLSVQKLPSHTAFSISRCTSLVLIYIRPRYIITEKKPLTLRIPCVCHLFIPLTINDVLVICVRKLEIFPKCSYYVYFKLCPERFCCVRPIASAPRPFNHGLRGLQGTMHKLL